ncbi:YceI family protein [Nitratiruptor sp. YY09-18]|uniref:YceI family protein n=1 Tax=Nitratiruptor sp. YY09-18 TaxID=2724901 RepID=UPI0019154E21|nr:YceI family protein [Nitratiruptor sp. YY09-18]BCD67844.1 hypothetical protein NitYY0918_C0751 [Nitratiruptor sp. YY09-18]
MRKLLLTIAAAALLLAGECSLENLTWTAYKTPLKLGVKGTFGKIAFIKGKDCLDGAEVKINKHSVDTNNPDRDKTLDQYFFAKLRGDIIAKVLKVDEKTLDVVITLNGVTKKIPFYYTKKDGVIKAKGVIDILDFQGNSVLRSIANACYKKHQGKTWNDVTLEFTINNKTKIDRAKEAVEQFKSMM